MLKFNQLTLRRGTRLLLRDVSFTIHDGEKVGITGANGAGKSSLFALIRGELHADGGDLLLSSGQIIAHVAQETQALNVAALDHVMDGDTELRKTQVALEQAERDRDGHRQAKLHDRLAAIDGYTAHSRAARLMHGLGFESDQEQAAVETLSGGWRERLNLARALMSRSDVLLLDEPTNHLDLDAVIWLENWLCSYTGTLLLISHDRDFLDRVCDHIAHIERQGITLYTGNYSAFERQRAAQLANQQAAHEKQQREISHIQQFINRFRTKATKAKQAQSRLKALQRMQVIAPAHVDSQFQFHFPPPKKIPNPLLQLEDLTAGYAQKPVLEGVNLSLLPGQRIGLLGHNGAGKSTLIKILATELQPIKGSMEAAADLKPGYFAQHQLEQLDVYASALLHLQRLDGSAAEQELRNFLGGFGFQGERVKEPVAPFSGGEKARLLLALLVYQRPNLLLLDEPTNHLDLEMRHALTMALQDFEGAMVLVSHDRHLLRSVTDELLLVHDSTIIPFAGTLDDYPRWLTDQRKVDSCGNENTVSESSSPTRKERRREEAELRRQLQPLRQQAKRLEQNIEHFTNEQSSLQEQITDPSLYEPENKSKLMQLLQEQNRLSRALEEAEEAWLSVCDKLEEKKRSC